MRHIILGLTLSLFFIGCGSSNNDTKKEEPTATPIPSKQPVQTGDRPSIPNIEVGKTPPSIPNI